MSLQGNLSLNGALSGSLSTSNNLSGQLQSSNTMSGNLSNLILRGYSAYEIAVQNGFQGTQEEWLDSLKNNVNFKIEEDIIYWKPTDDSDWTILVDLSEYDYNKLTNKPSINGVELSGNKTSEDLKIATKTIQKQTSLLASGWINDLSPYIYTIADSDIKSDSIIDINMAFDPSMEQIRAFSDAVIVAYSQSDGQYQLKAYGNKPNIDLPILLTIGM